MAKSKHPCIDALEFGRMFDAHVVTGIIDGGRRTALLLWSAQRQVGVSWGSRGTEAIWTVDSLLMPRDPRHTQFQVRRSQRRGAESRPNRTPY